MWRLLACPGGQAAHQAFRQDVIAIWVPDPGEQEIADFVGDDFKAAHPERYESTGA